MINIMGSFSAIFLGLCILLSLIFLLAYPLFRPMFLALHPRFGSALLLVYWLCPFLMSLASTSVLFMPEVESVLVDSHCHAECVSHVPMLHSPELAVLGLLLGGALLLSLLLRCIDMLAKSRQLNTQFNHLGRDLGAYQQLNGQTPLVFTLGWWQPRIYLSEGLESACSNTDLSIILLHEKAHQERKDNLRLLLAKLCSLVIYRPSATRMLSDLQLLTEQACDFRAAEKHGYVNVAQTLLKVKRLLKQAGPTPACAMAFADNDVELRIKALLKAQQRVKLYPWQLGLIVSSLIVSMSLLISPLHHGSEWLIMLMSNANVIVH